MNSDVIKWLKTGPPWVQYRTLTDLLAQSDSHGEVAASRQAMLEHPKIRALLSELSQWPGPALKRHNDAGHPLHKLVFVADLGLKAGDPGVDEIINRVVGMQSREGAFQIKANISPQYGGSGEDQTVWMLCDAPSVLYGMVRLGVSGNPIRSAAEHLAGLSFDHGWPCVVTPELGRFRGPGRKTDPCPYATLVALKALAQMPEWRESRACLDGAETLLQLWEQRKERRPYMFAMGTDFAKMKMPMVWYDILHVVDVLTQFPHLFKDRRLLEMVDILRAKADDKGRFTAESVWKAWSDSEFGQKKIPSYLLTLRAYRVLERIAAAV
jgi:hypothetical protein